MQPTITTGPMGIAYRDLNGNGVMDPYENPQLSVAERVDDLLPRLSLAEKVGLMFHTVIEAGTDGTVLEAPGHISKSGTSVAVVDKLINHFNIHDLTDARMAARWHNALQAVAERTPHGIPVTVSTDPRTAFCRTAGPGSPRPRSRSGPNRSASPRSTTSTRSRSSPGSPVPSTPPSASGPPCTRPSISPPNRGGAVRPTPSAPTAGRPPPWLRRISTVCKARPSVRPASLARPSTSPAAVRRRTARTRTSRTDASRSIPAAGSPSISRRSARRSSITPLR